MSRGNKREIDRERAAKRSADLAKREGHEGDPKKRNEENAKALAEKVAKKKAEAEKKALEDAKKVEIPSAYAERKVTKMVGK